jgi:hypothetical protein
MTRARDLANFQTSLDARPVPGAAGIPFRTQAGIFSTYGGVPTTVTFTSGRFTQTPIVSATSQDQNQGWARASASSSSSALIYAYSTGGVLGMQGYFIAVQMTSGSGSG